MKKMNENDDKLKSLVGKRCAQCGARKQWNSETEEAECPNFNDSKHGPSIEQGEPFLLKVSEDDYDVSG